MQSPSKPSNAQRERRTWENLPLPDDTLEGLADRNCHHLERAWKRRDYTGWTTVSFGVVGSIVGTIISLIVLPMGVLIASVSALLFLSGIAMVMIAAVERGAAANVAAAYAVAIMEERRRQANALKPITPASSTQTPHPQSSRPPASKP